MSSLAPELESPSRAVRMVLAVIDRCRPPRPTAGRVAFQLRFLIGACLLATVVALGSVVVSVWDGDPVGTAMIGVFLAAILVQLAALRLGASVAVLTRTLLLTVGAVLVAMALVTRELLPEQLFWLALLPLCAVVLEGPRADEAGAPGPVLPTALAVWATLAAGVFVVAAHVLGLTLDARSRPSPLVGGPGTSRSSSPEGRSRAGSGGRRRSRAAREARSRGSCAGVEARRPRPPGRPTRRRRGLGKMSRARTS
ncbi:MAG: hypothetical protein U0599_01850 [Vicinamibacteria bacterium]